MRQLRVTTQADSVRSPVRVRGASTGVILIVLLHLSTAAAWSQAEAAAAEPAAAGPAADGAIDPSTITKLIAGDQIILRVLGEGAISGTYRIRDDGNVFLPIVREVPLAGLTVPEATQALEEAIGEYIIKPQIGLELGALAARKVYLSGEVGGRGVQPWTVDLTLLKLINSAGGIPPTGDVTSIRLKRGDEVQVIDATDLLQGDFDKDIALEPDDMILVPRRARCFIMGPVPGAGDAYFEPGETLYQLFSRLGILSANTELRTVRLVRREATMVVNMDVIRRTGDTESDVRLAHLDKIIVPEGGEIYLAGAVRTPGTRPLRGSETAMKAILGAGGFREDGALDRCILVHDEEPSEVDLSRVLLAGDTTTDVALADGDLLLIPENKVLMFGAVGAPGPIALPWPARLSQALAAAGGAQPSSDLRRVTIVREGEAQVLDVRGFYEGGAVPDDPRLEPFDIVLVPEAFVSVSGMVAAAGRIPYRQSETMQDLLATVGNPVPDADLTAVYLIRGNDTQQLDITSLVREGDPTANVSLEPGDKVIFPEGLGRRIYITGQVSTTTGGGAMSLRYEEAPDVARAIASVSGVLTGGGDITQAKILRKGEVIPVDLHALYYENDLTQNVPLEPGDTIWIPANEHGYVYVFGVAGTRQVPHFPGIRMTQVMAQLGIPPDGASTNDVRLLRGTGEDRMIISIPWGRLWESPEGEEIKDPELERGDIILVREKSADKRWRQFRGITDKYFLTRSLIPAGWLPF